MQEDWVLCRVFQKRKDSELDNAAGSSSPTFAGASPGVLPDDQPMMMDASYVADPQPGSSVGFAPAQENLGGLEDQLLMMNGAIWQYSSSVLQHFPQQVTSSSPMMGLGLGSRGGDGDGCGGFFYDSGFEDMANIGGMAGFPQGWMG